MPMNVEAAPKFSKAGFPLTALSLGRMLEVSFRLWERKLGLFFGTALLFNLPYLLFSFWMGIDFNDPAVMEAIATEHLFTLFLFGFFNFFLLVVMEGVIIQSSVEAYVGNPVGLMESLQTIFPRIPSLIWVSLLFMVLFTLGCVLLIVPGIYFLLIAFLAIPVVVAEEARGMGAIRRSRDLMRGEKAKALGFILLWILFGLALQWVLGKFPGGMFRQMLDFLSGLLILSYVCVFTTVLYLQSCFGKEDIQT